MNCKPIIIIGAPRSGTNMLRDILCKLDGISTWPCDEINYIWRHGNLQYNSDEILPQHATPKIRKYIKKQFKWVAKKYNTPIVIEKTCANSLRVPFVDSIIPEAKYIFIHRDGIDSVGSAMQRWTANLDILYIAKKVRFVPISDLPYYGTRYFWNRVYRLFSKEERLAFWGPQLNNMPALLSQHTLDEVCALQWQSCVDKAANAFAVMPKEKWIRVSYEEFVRNPKAELKRITDFMALEVPNQILDQTISDIRSDSLGKGRAALEKNAIERLEKLVSPTLKNYGYI